MVNLLDLYDLAEQHGTPVYWFDLGAAESLSLQMEDGSCAIAMDPWRIPTLSDEKVKLAHELGHCETGADELKQAILQGYREPWELAEYFGVTEAFLRGALKYYQEL